MERRMEVARLVKLGEEILGKESRLRQLVLTKLIEELGWDLVEDVKIEESYPVGSGNWITPDYVLENGNSRLVIEAKGPEEYDLEAYSDQVNSYIGVVRAQYGCLYNGRELLVYHIDKSTPIYRWVSGQSIEIFFGLSKDSYPNFLDSIQKQEGLRDKLSSFIKEDFSQIRSQVLDYISDKLKVSPDFIVDNLDIEVTLAPQGPQAEQNGTYNYDNNNSKAANSPEVVVCSANTYSPCTGINFIEETGGYGFFQLRRNRQPKYLATYEPEQSAITHLYAIKEIKRGDMSIAKSWKNCFDALEDNDDYSSGKTVFFSLGEEIKDFKPIKRGPDFFMPGIRFVETLEEMLKAKDTSSIFR
ncbi:hypothetical protein IX51_01840 [uncultured archaeon]|nr:hypothetical protein IX51_01840 [uncultured archaeon]